LRHRDDKEGFVVKNTVAMLTVTALTLSLALTASAQTRPSTESSSQPARQAWAPPTTALETSKLIGTKVKNEAGKDIGEIDQLIVDSHDGKITHVVLGKGGVLGVGEQKLVLPWSDIKLQADPSNRNRTVAMVDQSKTDAAPRYEARRNRETAPAASPRTAPGTRSDQK
jgi:sporulation protein YlmC with PRC-barrel domain